MPTAAAVLWLGGRDAHLLAALSLLAVGSCNFCTRFVVLQEEDAKNDAVLIPAYAIALSVVSALRIAGLTWWECLLPLPSIAYLVPVIRFFFPRSGLRGQRRKEAIADIPRLLVADIRSDAEKLRDEKVAKRRQREARRVARLRR